MEYKDSLYCLMERSMAKMTSANDLTTLQKKWKESVREYYEYAMDKELRDIIRISYSTWLDQTYLMLRTYLKE